MDEVVSMVSYRDYVLIVTKRGKIYKLVHDELYGFKMSLHGELDLGRA